jgi:hypothetical protein
MLAANVARIMHKLGTHSKLVSKQRSLCPSLQALGDFLFLFFNSHRILWSRARSALHIRKAQTQSIKQNTQECIGFITYTPCCLRVDTFSVQPILKAPHFKSQDLIHRLFKITISYIQLRPMQASQASNFLRHANQTFDAPSLILGPTIAFHLVRLGRLRGAAGIQPHRDCLHLFRRYGQSRQYKKTRSSHIITSSHMIVSSHTISVLLLCGSA